MAFTITIPNSMTPKAVRQANRMAQGGSLQESSDKQLGPGVQDELLRGQQARARHDREQCDQMRQLAMQLGRHR